VGGWRLCPGQHRDLRGLRFDKRRAVHGGRRVAERTLHILELLGGWPGALFGQVLFRHKRRKLTYMLVFLGILGFTFVFWITWYRLAR